MGYFAFPNSISAGGDSLSASDFNTATNPGNEGGGEVSLGDTIISGIVEKSPGDTISFSDFAGYTAAHFQVQVGQRNNDPYYGFSVDIGTFGNMYNQGEPVLSPNRQNNYYFTQGSTGTALPVEGFMMSITSCFWREFPTGTYEFWARGTDTETPAPQYSFGGILDNPSPPPDYIDVPHSFWRWHRLSVGPRASQLGTSYPPPPLPYNTQPSNGGTQFTAGAMPWKISGAAGTNPFGTTVGARVEVVFSTNRNDLSSLV